MENYGFRFFAALRMTDSGGAAIGMKGALVCPYSALAHGMRHIQWRRWKGRFADWPYEWSLRTSWMVRREVATIWGLVWR